MVLVKLYIENVNASGRKDLKMYISIKGQEFLAEAVKLDMVTVDILEIASDQIPGATCNKLPSPYYNGFQNNPMLMGTRSGNEAYIKLKIKTGDGGHGSNLLAKSVHVCAVPSETRGNAVLDSRSIYSSMGTSSNDFKPSAQWTEMDFIANGPIAGTRTSSGTAERYEVVWAVDLNEDDLISRNEIFGSFGKTPKTREDKDSGDIVTADVKNLHIKDLLHICNEAGTNKAWELIEDDVDDLPGFAGDLGEYFVNGDESEITGEAEGEIQRNIPISSDILSHPVGIPWGANCMGETVRAYFDEDSDFSDFVGEHLEDNTDFYARVAEKYKEQLVNSVSPNNKVAEVTVQFEIDHSFYGEDQDLSYSLGNIKVKGTVVFKVTYDTEILADDEIHIELGRVQSKVEDNYDFTYRQIDLGFWVGLFFEEKLPAYASVLQASATSGYFAKSPAVGRPYFIEIDIDMDGGWDNVLSWDIDD